MKVQQSPYLAGSIPRALLSGKSGYQHPEEAGLWAPPSTAILNLPLFLWGVGGRKWTPSLFSSCQPAAFLGVEEDLGRSAPGPCAENTQRLAMAYGYLLEGEKDRKGWSLQQTQALEGRDHVLQTLKDISRTCKFICMKIIAKINKFNHTQLYI